MAGSGVREVARRAVRAEIVATAECLFQAQGYDATTVDHIAERVGISQRTFFRYIGSKEDLVLANFDEQSDRMIEVLQSRPATESAWTSLRRVFDVVVSHRRDQDRESVQLLRSILDSSAAVRSAYLDRMDLIQRRLTDVLLERSPTTEPRVYFRALVGSAFASLHAVSETCELNKEGPDTFAADLDRVLRRLEPAGDKAASPSASSS